MISMITHSATHQAESQIKGIKQTLNTFKYFLHLPSPALVFFFSPVVLSAWSWIIKTVCPYV